MCHMSRFNWLLVTSISFFEVNAMCVQKSLRVHSPFSSTSRYSLPSRPQAFGFQNCLKLLFPHLAIVKRKLQTRIMIQPTIVVLIIAVIVVRVVLRTRGIPLVSLGFLQKLSKNNLGKPLALKLASHPVPLRLFLWTKRRPSIVVQLVFIPK